MSRAVSNHAISEKRASMHVRNASSIRMFRDLNYTLGIYNVTCRSDTPKMDEAFEIVKQALDVYGRETYEELSFKAICRADQMMMKVLSFLRSLIIT